MSIKKEKGRYIFHAQCILVHEGAVDTAQQQKRFCFDALRNVLL